MAESKGNAKMPILLYRGEHFDSNFSILPELI